MPEKTTNTERAVIRCAIYTRKSTEEGLDQEFNSLDAQRESGEAYITSLRHEGWIALPTRYDDGGYTGGNIERPALQQLMKDIAAGKVDAVVIYKIDRLSRSLLDFAKLMDVFEKRKVALVAVTQQFNTATSMGRLVLNVLLSFAQFEREVIAERVRDKIAMAKAKGKHTGGMQILGYDLVNGKLVVNSEEARIVRRVFEEFVQSGSTTEIAKQLRDEGCTMKSWVTRKGRSRQGQPIHKQHLYAILHKRTYLGEVEHKDKVYKGEHEAIIDRRLWDKAHAILVESRKSRGRKVRMKHPTLLGGLLYCGHCGRLMTGSYSRSRGKLYRYYLCLHANKHGHSECPIRNVATGEIESAVTRLVRAMLRAPEIAAQALRAGKGRYPGLDEAGVSAALRKTDELWGVLFPREQARIIALLVERVTMREDGLEVRLRSDGLVGLAGELREVTPQEKSAKAEAAESPGEGPLVATATITEQAGAVVVAIPACFKRRVGRKEIVLPDAQEVRHEPQPLAVAVARGFRWQQMLDAGEVTSIREIAASEGVDKAYIGRATRLALLAPDIVTAILAGEEPSGLSLNQLASRIPLLWREQRKALGFAREMK